MCARTAVIDSKTVKAWVLATARCCAGWTQTSTSILPRSALRG